MIGMPVKKRAMITTMPVDRVTVEIEMGVGKNDMDAYEEKCCDDRKAC